MIMVVIMIMIMVMIMIKNVIMVMIMIMIIVCYMFYIFGKQCAIIKVMKKEYFALMSVMITYLCEAFQMWTLMFKYVPPSLILLFKFVWYWEFWRGILSLTIPKTFTLSLFTPQSFIRYANLQEPLLYQGKTTLVRTFAMILFAWAAVKTFNQISLLFSWLCREVLTASYVSSLRSIQQQNTLRPPLISVILR